MLPGPLPPARILATSNALPLPDASAASDATPFPAATDDCEAIDLRRQLADARREAATARTELERCQRDFDHFAYVTSHDLSEPLRVMGGYAGMLERRYDAQLDDRGRRYLSNLSAGAQHMQAQLDALLTYSRARTRPLSLQPVVVETALADALAQLAPALAESGATVTHGSLGVVQADPDAVRIVLGELIANAIRFNDSDAPRVEVFAETAGATTRIEVHDDGIGVAPEQRDRAFELLARLTPRATYPGLGAGLAVCQQLVSGLGGRIWMTDSPRGGVCVTVELPSAAAHAFGLPANDGVSE